jgi:hypothetical protein
METNPLDSNGSSPGTEPAKPRRAPAPRIPIRLHRNLSVIRTNHAHTAEELLARKKLATLLAGRLADDVLLVRSGQEQAVIEELRKMGHAPQVTRGASG